MSAHADGMKKPRNILFIMADQLRWDYLSCYGHPHLKTPNIDRLAARGMAFTNAQSPSAICHAARTAILTGLRPSTSGIYGNGPDWRRQEIFRDKPTLPRFFRDNGYATQGAGNIFHAQTFTANGFASFNDSEAWDRFFPSLDRQLPDAVWSSLLDLFGVAYTVADAERMRHAARFNAKNPATAFTGDTATKQRAASAELRRLADQWVRPAYQQLVALQAAQGGTI